MPGFGSSVPAWLSQRTPASSSVAAAPTPLTGCAAI